MENNEHEVDDVHADARAAMLAVESNSPELQEQEQTPVDALEPSTTAEKDEPATTEAGPAEDAVEEKPEKIFKAPVSWKPTARVHFDKLPAEVQEQVAAREAEVDNLFRSTKEDREVAAQLKQISAPYEMDMRAMGTNPMAVYNDFLQASNTLRRGDPSSKATLIASIIKEHKVDLEILQDALLGQVQAKAPDPVMQKLEQLENAERQRQAYAESQIQTAAKSEYEKFLATKPEFLDDVKADMQFLLTNSKAHSFEDAYDKAVNMNADLRKAVAVRTSAPSVTTSQKIAAASSVKNNGPRASLTNTAPITQFDDEREAARAAFMKVTGKAPQR